MKHPASEHQCQVEWHETLKATTCVGCRHATHTALLQCKRLLDDMHDSWMQEHGDNTRYDSGRCTALYNVSCAISDMLRQVEKTVVAMGDSGGVGGTKG